MKVIRYLLDQGVDVDRCSHRGRTPLHWAAHQGNLIPYYLAHSSTSSSICTRLNRLTQFAFTYPPYPMSTIPLPPPPPTSR